MTDTLETHPEMQKDPYNLASLVAEKVEIENVLLAKCVAERASTLAGKGSEVTLTFGVSNLGFGRSPESNRLIVTPTFAATLTSDADEKTEVLVSIRARFIVMYSVTSFEGIDDEHLRAFSATNGVFNAWPYWREFVQNMTARMGLPVPITIPVFRLGDNPFSDSPSSDFDSSEAAGKAD
jgi:hypothetical protein